MGFPEWWKTFWENDCTWLITAEEHKTIDTGNYKEFKSNIVDVNWECGYFKGGGLVGFKYLKSREAKYIEKLYDLHQHQIEKTDG